MAVAPTAVDLGGRIEVIVKPTVLLLCTAALLWACSRSPAPVATDTTVAAAAGAPTFGTSTMPPGQPAGTQQGFDQSSQAAQSATAARPVPETLPEVVARVNGEPVSRAELEQAIASLEAQAGRTVPPEERDEVYRSVLDQIVTGHVLLQASRERKIAATEADVEARLAQLRQRFPGEEEFRQALERRRLTEDRLREDLRKQMAIERMLEAEVQSRITVTDQDVKAYYDANPEQFRQPEMFRASHILVLVAPDATPAEKQEARNRINEVLREVRAGGDFAELARKHSQDGSASQGGDLNYFARGQMVEPFQKAVEALKPGEVSDIVETQFGFHIVKLTDRRPARTIPLAEVNEKIGQFLVMQQRQQRAAAFVEGLKAKSRIEILM